MWTQLAIYLVVCAVVGSAFVILSALLAPRKAKLGKLDTYECGVPMVGEARERFSVKFYIVAIMFILFDIETVFLIPWAVLFRQLGVLGLVEVGIFFAVLGFGLLYLWKRGGLEWD
jgi:NADH-quinone oxidoreductase subunit A